jgi:hypothetical protein
MQAMVCQPTGSSPAGCTAGQECVPAAPGGFETHFCVTKAGSNSCPAGFPTQHLYYADVSDNRACGPCSCDPPTGVDCNANGRVTTWGNNMCTANQGASASPLPSGCMTASATHGLGFTTTPTGGSCAPTGGQPTGSVSPQTITTICCAP